MNTNELNKREFLNGIKMGFPICLGYFPVSFTYGVMAVHGGFPVWAALLMSMTNLTSSGQFAGTNLIFAGASYFEIALTTFVINMRYMLMSISLSQKLKDNTKRLHRFIFGAGITDEVFAFASVRPKEVTAPYMYGLIFTPYIGWASGTLLGALASNILPSKLSTAMGIALYAMFIAIIIPASKKSFSITLVIIISVAITCILKYIPGLSLISPGFRTIISTLVSCGIIAYLYPVKDGES